MSTTGKRLLLLEWADGQSPAESWPIAVIRPGWRTALGRAQAPFAAGRALPPVSWLSRDNLRQYSSEKPVDVGAAGR